MLWSEQAAVVVVVQTLAVLAAVVACCKASKYLHWIESLIL